MMEKMYDQNKKLKKFYTIYVEGKPFTVEVGGEAES